MSEIVVLAETPGGTTQLVRETATRKIMILSPGKPQLRVSAKEAAEAVATWPNAVIHSGRNAAFDKAWAEVVPPSAPTITDDEFLDGVHEEVVVADHDAEAQVVTVYTPGQRLAALGASGRGLLSKLNEPIASKGGWRRGRSDPRVIEVDGREIFPLPTYSPPVKRSLSPAERKRRARKAASQSRKRNRR